MAWESKRRPPSEYLNPHKQRRVLEYHGYICHLCGHDGATEVDHVTSWSEWTRTDLSVHDASNLAPAHGTACPTCGRDCHADKTKAEAARGRARSNARREAVRRRPDEPHPGRLG